MIIFTEAVKIHSILIDQFGGSSGLRDKGLLESALKRPFQTFDGKELYPTPVEKSAAILESIVKNHPFIDGNKRTGYVLARLILLDNSIDINATQKQKYELVIQVSKGEMAIEDISQWLRDHTQDNIS